MHPILFHCGIPVYTYGALMAIAFLVGIKITLDKAAKAGVGQEFLMNLFLVILVSSIVGARTMYVLENWEYFRKNLLEIPMVQHGGLSYFGGLLFALTASVIAVRRAHQSFLGIADLLAPGLALGQAIGRLGCYFNGCCFGILSDGPWAVMFPQGSAAFAHHWSNGWVSALDEFSLPVIPAQLLSSILDVFLFCLLSGTQSRSVTPGVTLFSYLIGYGCLRFSMEFLRVNGPVPQYLALASIVAGLAGLTVLSLRRSQTLAQALPKTPIH